MNLPHSPSFPLICFSLAPLACRAAQGVEQMTKDLKRDQYFTPQEAVDYGLIDKVIFPRRSKQMGL